MISLLPACYKAYACPSVNLECPPCLLSLLCLPSITFARPAYPACRACCGLFVVLTPPVEAHLPIETAAGQMHTSHTHRFYLVFQTPPVPLQPIAPPSRPETSCGDAINGCLTKRYTRTTTRANVPLSFHTSSMLCLQWSDEQFLRHLTHMICSQRLAVMNASIACTTSRGTSRCCWSIPSLNAFEPHSAACADVQCCD